MDRKKDVDFTRPSYFPVRIQLGACSSGALYSLPYARGNASDKSGKDLFKAANSDEVDNVMRIRNEKDAA